ncbi:helix-turn-helix domain-containing protein [Gluconobacter oxydans]|uniref:helix-turn-helix domain-containing protein n=1 Tax=Gluconobacter oxydans TaxID=442 RepID=UPI0039E9F196
MPTGPAPSDLTPKHVRAARALLAWSQQDLAKAAGVATSTVADFERGQRTPVANNAQAIRQALEKEDITFLEGGAVVGPIVSTFAATEKPGLPIRWVSAADLSRWADLTIGVVDLPMLLSNLIRATLGTSVRMSFPSGESVRHPGWDGRTSAGIESEYVPLGEAAWEIGAQRSNITTKANDDYQKRTVAPGPVNPTETTFVFVTPRPWNQKDEWIAARKAEGIWRDVRAYDADDLVHWIEQTPAVGLQLATHLNKRPEGTRELEEIWQEWSLATQWPLTADLVLSDRDEDEAAVLRWLRGEPSVLSLQATTADELVSFFHATLGELPDGIAQSYRARCLVATTVDAARALANAPAPLILLLTEPEPGLAQSLVRQGHYVLQAYDERAIGRGEIRKLARPSREGIANALTAAGIAAARAHGLARDSARNLAILRRLIPDAPGRLPKWAEQAPPNALLVALLAGGWDENSEADKARLSELADEPYDVVISNLATFVGEWDSPLQKVGSTWRIASPFDAWFLLAKYLTRAHIDRFEAAAYAVLGSMDPRFDIDPNERWMAAVRGIHRDYSGMLRQGIEQVLILLALWSGQITTVDSADRRVGAIVQKLLEGADERRWWSLSRDFRLLAEAAPEAFLTAIEDSLDRNDPPIAVLFGHDEGGLFGTEHLSDLMWALESLAWSPDWMPRVSHLLARLDAIDIKPRRYSNGPANSLREIHLLWNPQTYATLEERLRALDLIRKRETNAAWKLMLGILPQGHDASTPSPSPLWRDFSVDNSETVTWALVGRGAAALSERLLDDVGLSPERWTLLLDRLSDLAPDGEKALAALEMAEPQITGKDGRAILWRKLRGILHHHRQFAGADWSLPKDVLKRIEAIYEKFAPSDALENNAWLFQNGVQLPNPSGGWENEAREIKDARQEAARAIYTAGGISDLLSLARMSDTAGFIGKALVDTGVPADELDSIIETAIRSDDAHECDLAHGIIVSVVRDRPRSWAENLLATAQSEKWGDTAVLAILRAFPIKRWTWDLATGVGSNLEDQYWRLAPVCWMNETSDDIIYAIHKLIGVGRARHALALINNSKALKLPTDLIVEALKEAARQPLDPNEHANDLTMFQYYVAELLQLLDKRDDVDRKELVWLEWNYLRVLEHSRRPAKVLLEAMSEQPSLFIEMISAVSKPSEESGIVEPEPEDRERAHAIATQAYRLLEQWNRLPGTCADGTIDGEELEEWIKEARRLAKEVGREGVADRRIGTMLSASPMGGDGNWPAEPVRDALDLFRSKSMLEGFWIGKSNRRGVTSRMPRDGGDQERHEAQKYRRWGKAISIEHPRTAKALDQLADSCDRDAKRQDEDAERLDWEH